MSIEYLPVGIACNIKCEYCYQDPMRDAGNINVPRDWSAARAILEKHNHKFTVFGGEPLLAPIEHLEDVFKFGFERFETNGIQTNGTLITERHIELFKKYGVRVGVSCDGPAELNSFRRDGSSDRETMESTQRTLDSIRRLCSEKLLSGVIVTVHRMNASAERRPALISWLRELEKLGVPEVNFHMLEVECGKENIALSEKENMEAFLDFYEFSRTSKMYVLPFRDIRKMLLDEEGEVSCIWNACDALTTRAVQGVTPDGVESNCGRTNKDGVNWVKADSFGSERYIALRYTPQEFGGCQDCRFFVFCKGNCPGTAIDNDWRNRTVHCSTWYHLFSTIEREIIAQRRLPASKNSRRLEELLSKLFSPPPTSSHSDTPHHDWHCDSTQSDTAGVNVTWL